MSYIKNKLQRLKGAKIIDVDVIDNYGVDIPTLIVELPNGDHLFVSLVGDDEGNSGASVWFTEG